MPWRSTGLPQGLFLRRRPCVDSLLSTGWVDLAGRRRQTRGRMADEVPNRAYYRAVEGVWACRLDLSITDWRAFRAAPMGLAERLRMLAMLASMRLAGACRLDTSVDASRNPVVHTTRVSKWGMTMMRSTEWLSLDANGRDGTMRIAMRYWPNLRREQITEAAPFTVDADGRRADYRIPWFGTEMRQRGECNAAGDTVTLVQETAFSRSVQVLRRQAGAVRPG